jgi:hypothetical protein
MTRGRSGYHLAAQQDSFKGKRNSPWPELPRHFDKQNVIPTFPALYQWYKTKWNLERSHKN